MYITVHHSSIHMPSRHSPRTVMLELVPARERKIMQIKLFWTDNAKCSVEYDFYINICDCSHVNLFHGCIHGDHIATICYRNPEVICFHRLPYKPCQFVEHSWHSQMQQSAFQIQWWTQWHNGQMVQIYQCTGIAFPTTSFCQSCQPGSVLWILPDDGTIHFAYLSGYGPVGCGNASCEPIELQPCRSK